MSQKEALKQRIAGHIAFRSPLMTINMVLIGALAVLLINMHTLKEIIVFVIGLILESMIFLLTVDMNKDLENFYKEMEDLE